MEGLTQVSVLILVGVCLAAIPMAVAVKALERLIQYRGSPAIAASAGNTPTGDLDEEILPYISSAETHTSHEVYVGSWPAHTDVGCFWLPCRSASRHVIR